MFHLRLQIHLVSFRLSMDSISFERVLKMFSCHVTRLFVLFFLHREKPHGEPFNSILITDVNKAAFFLFISTFMLFYAFMELTSRRRRRNLLPKIIKRNLWNAHFYTMSFGPSIKALQSTKSFHGASCFTRGVEKKGRTVCCCIEWDEIMADYFHNKKVVRPEKITENYQLTIASPLLGSGFMAWDH